MGQKFAGILGPLAFATVVARGVIQGSDAAATLGTASLCLFVFAGVGYVVGRMAQEQIDLSVRARFAEEVEAARTPHGGGA